MRRLFLRGRRPAFTRTLSAHGMRTLIVCAVVALICARVFGGA
ncbi:MAG: hypothetical protein ACK4OJ_12040 [Brevundimonas sp.]